MYFCVGIWRCEHKLSKVFIAQKRAIRTIFGITRASKFVKGHTKPVFCDNKILTVHNAYYHSVYMDTFTILNNGIPEYLNQHLTRSHRDTTSSRLIMPLIIYSCLKNNFYFTAPKLWNILTPSKNFNLIPYTSPKKKLKSYLLNLQGYGDLESWTPCNTSVEAYESALKSSPYVIWVSWSIFISRSWGVE